MLYLTSYLTTSLVRLLYLIVHIYMKISSHKKSYKILIYSASYNYDNHIFQEVL